MDVLPEAAEIDRVAGNGGARAHVEDAGVVGGASEEEAVNQARLARAVPAENESERPQGDALRRFRTEGLEVGDGEVSEHGGSLSGIALGFDLLEEFVQFGTGIAGFSGAVEEEATVEGTGEEGLEEGFDVLGGLLAGGLD